MQNCKRILVAVDGSPASRRVVNYVADLVGGQKGRQTITFGGLW
jgi:hypothetical protein